MQEKIINILSKRPFQVSLLLHVLLFGLTYSFFTPFYQTNDDVGMMLMVRGVSTVTEPSEYVLFMNVLLGKFLKNLFLLYPDFDWYSFFMVSCLFVSYTVFGASAIRGGDIGKLLIYIGAFILLGIPVLVELQFTIIASVLAASGYFLLLKNNSIAEIIIGVFTLITSSLIRIDAYLLTTVLAAPVFLFMIFYRYNKHLIMYPTIAFGISLLLSQYSNYLHDHYNNNCYTFNKYRNSLAYYTFDQRVDAQTKTSLLNKVGWSENDYQMFHHWIFMNDSIYNVQSFKYLLDHAPTSETSYMLGSLLKIRSYFFLYDYAKSSFSLSAFLILLALLTLYKSDYRVSIFHIFMWIYVFGVIVVIRYTMKAPPERVYIPMFIFLGMLPFIWDYYSRDFSSKFTKQSLAGIILVLFSASMFNIKTYYDNSNIIRQYSKSFKTFLAESNFENKLIVVVGIGLTFEHILPFENISYLQKLDLFGLGCSQQSNQQRKLLEKYGISNFYLALIENPNVYIAVYEPLNDLELIKRYYQEHYHINIRHEVVATFGARKIIKLFCDV